MADAMKPCPFCGNRAILRVSRDTDGRMDGAMVSCDFTRSNHCGASGDIRATEVDAIAAWNRRSPLAPPTDAEVEVAALAAWNRDAIKPFDGLPGIFKDACLEDARAALAAFVAGRTGG